MIQVHPTDKGHEGSVLVRINDAEIRITECANTGDIVMDTYIGGLPVVTVFKAKTQTFMRVFKQACESKSVQVEVK